MINNEAFIHKKLLNFAKHDQNYNSIVSGHSNFLKSISKSILCTFECRYGGVEVIYVKKQDTKDSYYQTWGNEFREYPGSYNEIQDVSPFFDNKKYKDYISFRSHNIRSNFRYDCTTRVGTTVYVVVTQDKIFVYDNLNTEEETYTGKFVEALVGKLVSYMNSNGMNPVVVSTKILCDGGDNE